MKTSVSFTIFGATGDLCYRKLLPALYRIFLRGDMESFQIIAVAKDISFAYPSKVSEQLLLQNVEGTEDDLKRFCEHIDCFKMDVYDMEQYAQLNRFYTDIFYEHHIVYYAVAPEHFDVISEGLCLLKDLNKPKIIVEKPYGTDLNSAESLHKKLQKRFGAEHIYYMDHYLGKRMVRALPNIRSCHPMLEMLWKHGEVESVFISALEELGVERRGRFYDKSGALKDMVQNHLFQMLSLLALNETKEDRVKGQCERLRQLRSVECLNMEETMVLGQYEGYREEVDVEKNSETETFAMLKLYMDCPEWQGIPFFLQTGKKCSKSEVEVLIQFRRLDEMFASNVLHIKIQPEENIEFVFHLKGSGTDEVIKAEIEPYNRIAEVQAPQAYERMLLHCIEGDRSWFVDWEQIRLSWDYIESLLQKYRRQGLPVYPYKVHQDGPKEVRCLRRASSDRKAMPD